MNRARELLPRKLSWSSVSAMPYFAMSYFNEDRENPLPLTVNNWLQASEIYNLENIISFEHKCLPQKVPANHFYLVNP